MLENSVEFIEIEKNMSFVTSVIVAGEEDELQRRLEKLSKNYDMTTMKIFIVVESLGDKMVTSVYDAENGLKWTQFLVRTESCRLDLSKNENTRNAYDGFLESVSREDQARQFHAAFMQFLCSKGAADPFQHMTEEKTKYLQKTFSMKLCTLFQRKISSWFDSFEAVCVRLTGHVTVSNYVRVLTGNVDVLCRRHNAVHAMNVKVTGMDSPRPLDVAELALIKMLMIQNGLAKAKTIKLCLLTLHLNKGRPVIRLWEYNPSEEMERAINEFDIDKVIDAGKLSQYHEFWKDNLLTQQDTQILQVERRSYGGDTTSRSYDPISTDDVTLRSSFVNMKDVSMRESVDGRRTQTILSNNYDRKGNISSRVQSVQLG